LRSSRSVAALFFSGLAIAACSSPPPPAKPGKGAGEACQVSTECGAGLRCNANVCSNITCASSTDCRGTPPDGCSAWACVAGLCESACFDDAGTPQPDATTFPDATEPPDLSITDTGEGFPDAPDDDTGVPDGGMPNPDATQTFDADIPDAGPCNMTARAPAAGELVLNEIHADPGGDANASGATDTADDEFIELGNISSSTLELSGVYVSDLIGTRHIFGSFQLGCGKVVVIFGGGDTAHPMWRNNWVVASTPGLALNNTGDTIRVGTSTSTPDNLLAHAYGNEANHDESIVREFELSPSAAFVRHSQHPTAIGISFSPGTRVDGTEF
jgi:hypothetical protein